LGILYQWNLMTLDLKESAEYLQKAIERNPLEQEYWLNLAKIFQKMGEEKKSGRALENATLVFPVGYQGRWIVGNLLLQGGDIEKALPHFSYILTHYPNQSSSVYDVLGMAVEDPDFILEKLIPKDAACLAQYLQYLYGNRDKKMVMKVWNLKTSLGHKADLGEKLRHIEFLISEKELQEAFRLWKTGLQEEGLLASSDGNLVTNGGFEREKMLGGGFDWRMSTVPGAKISFDHSTTVEGKHSLKIEFDGKENVDFQHIQQFVALKPSTNYLLKANVKTEGITTKSGLKIEIVGYGSALHKFSDSLTGDNDWKELSINFQTPPDAQGGVVRIRRASINNFDRFISGVAWIDNVRLVEDKKSH
jgi:tetratricopeptide (TPR) repeat protein